MYFGQQMTFQLRNWLQARHHNDTILEYLAIIQILGRKAIDIVDIIRLRQQSCELIQLEVWNEETGIWLEFLVFY